MDRRRRRRRHHHSSASLSRESRGAERKAGGRARENARFNKITPNSPLHRTTSHKHTHTMVTNVTRLLRGSLKTSPGPGGAGSIGHYVQPCRKIILTYCDKTPASAGVRQWLSGSKIRESGIVELARKWPQIEWVVQEAKRSQEPYITAHYGEYMLRRVCIAFALCSRLFTFPPVNSRTKTIGLHMFKSKAVQEKMELLLASTGRKLSGSGSRQGFNTSESRNYKKKPVETSRLQEPVRGHWSGFGPGSA